MTNIEFKGFKLIYANGNSIDQVLSSYSGATHTGILYLVRTDPDCKDGCFILNGKVYGSGKIVYETLYKEFGDALNKIRGTIEAITESGGTIDTKINTAIDGLNASAQTSGTTYISGSIVEENGTLTSFTIDETELGKKFTQIDTAIEAISADTTTINTAIQKLDATVSGISTNSGITVTIEQVNGKLSGVTVTDTLGTASKENVTDGTLSLPTDGTSSKKAGLTTAAQVENFVKESISDLAGAMHFEGVVTGDTLPDASGYNKGDVILVGTKEYVLNETEGVKSWVELGDEGIYLTIAAAEANYVKKTTTIAGVDLQNNITKEELREALSIKDVADGAQVNILEGVKVNGTALQPDSGKTVDITVTSGTANGTIKVNNVDVAVTGLGSAAYESVDAFDASGTATTEIAKISGTTSGVSTNKYVTVTTTQDHGKVTGITVVDAKLKTDIDDIDTKITNLGNEAVKNVNGQTGNTITLTSVDIKAGADVDGAGETTADKKVSEVLTDIYTKLNAANANAYTGITAANGDHTVIVTPTTHGHSVAVNLKGLNDTEKASGLIQLVSAKDGSGIYGQLFFDGEESTLTNPDA